MDIVDVRSFQKNALPILRSQKVLKSAVRSVVGPAFPIKLDKVQLSSDGSLVKENQNVSHSNHPVPIKSPSKKHHSTDNLHSSVSPSKMITSSMIEEDSATPRTHTSAQSEKRPTTSDLPLQYHTTQSIQEHKAKQLGFGDFLAPRQVSPSASIDPSIFSSVPVSTTGRKSPPLTGATSRQRSTAASTPMTPELSAAHNLIDIKGRYIPSNAIKDAMISTIRRHTDNLNREVLYSTNTPSLSSSIAEKDNANGDHLLKENSLDAPFSQITVDDSQNPTCPPPMAKIQSVGNMAKGELGFNDSIRSLPIGDLTELQGHAHSQKQLPIAAQLESSVAEHTLMGGKSRAISTKDIDESAAWKSLLSSTSRAKLASIVRVEDDYSMKWSKMKTRRDAQRQKEEMRQQQLALRHLFQRVQINSEQNDLHQVKTHQQQVQEEERNRNKKHIQEYHQLHDTFYHQRKAQREKEKQKETRQLKRTIARSVTEARRLVENEIAEHHASVLEQKNRAKEARWQEFANFSDSVGWVHPGSQYLGDTDTAGHDPADGAANEPPWAGSLEELSSFTGHSDPGHILLHPGNKQKRSTSKAKETQRDTIAETSLLLDDSVSSVVEIPAPLQRKLKAATSLRVHQEVKREIKDYYDSVMSMRIHRFVHSKEIARRQVAARERAHIAKTPFHAGMYFTDSLSLHSGALDDPVGSEQDPQAAAMRAVSAALTDPAATPLPPYHLDPLVVAETYGLSLASQPSLNQQQEQLHFYQHLPHKLHHHHPHPGVSAADSVAHLQHHHQQHQQPHPHHSALPPSESAHLLMRHTSLTPLTPLALESSMPSTLQSLPHAMALHPQQEWTDAEYAAYIAAAAAAVTSGLASPTNNPQHHQQQQQQQQQKILRSESRDSRGDDNHRKKSVRYADSLPNSPSHNNDNNNNDFDDDGLPPTSLGKKKKSMIMKSFSGLKTTTTITGLSTAETAMSGSSSSSADAEMFQLPGSKRSSVDPMTAHATYASLLRSKSIRKSMSGFLPVNAANFDAQTEEQTAILDKFQKKSLSSVVAPTTANANSPPVASTTVRKSVEVPTVSFQSSSSTPFSYHQNNNNNNNNNNATASSPSIVHTTPMCVPSSSVSRQETQRADEGSSVSSQSSQRSQQQVRLVLPPVVGVSRSNSSYSLNKGMSQPVLLLDELTPSSFGY